MNSRQPDLENKILSQVTEAFRSQIEVLCYDETGSVLDLARDINIASNKYALLVAARQTAGRGQHGRSWNNADLSFLGCLIFPSCSIAQQRLSAFSLVIALQIAEVLAELGVRAAVKWPNDIQTAEDGKKICGILLESESSAAGDVRIRAGIGANLAGAPPGAASVHQSTGRSVSIDFFSAKVVERCADAFRIFVSQGFSPFCSRWNEIDILRGRKIKFQYGDRVYAGTEKGVDTEGRICMEVEGSVVQFAAGQIIEY